MIGYSTNGGPIPQYIQTAGYSLGIVSTPGKPVTTFRTNRPLIRMIQDAVANHYGLRFIDMVSARRGRSVAWPRQVAMYLCRELTTSSLPNIGKHFGHRDHTTVIHAIKQVEKRMAAMPVYRADIEVLREALR